MSRQIFAGSIGAVDTVEHHMESAAHTQGACHANAAALRLNQTACQCQTQPGAFMFFAVAHVELLELDEQL